MNANESKKFLINNKLNDYFCCFNIKEKKSRNTIFKT